GRGSPTSAGDPIAHLYRRAGFGAAPAELGAGGRRATPLRSPPTRQRSSDPTSWPAPPSTLRCRPLQSGKRADLSEFVQMRLASRGARNTRGLRGTLRPPPGVALPVLSVPARRPPTPGRGDTR